jgi:hypothetical protein
MPGISAISEEEDLGSARRRWRREEDPGSIPGICNLFRDYVGSGSQR